MMMQPAGSAPISLGSTRSLGAETCLFRATEMWFPAGHRLPRHFHPLNGLAVMLEGSFDLGMDGRTLACPPGVVVIEPAGESHTNQMDRGGAHVLALQINPRDSDLREASGGALDRPCQLRDLAILACAWRIAGELKRADAVSRLAIEGLGLEMIAEVSRRRMGDPAKGSAPAWLRRAREMMHAHFLEPLGAAAIAREAGVHPVHLARVFRRHTGVSLGTYMRELRLERAAARLADSEDPISDIALECGFTDQAHFTRAFRSRTGTTPNRYRRVARDS